MAEHQIGKMQNKEKFFQKARIVKKTHYLEEDVGDWIPDLRITDIDIFIREIGIIHIQIILDNLRKYFWN